MRIARRRRVAVQGERGLERGDRELVGAQRAHQRMCGVQRRIASCVPTRIPAWGPPSSLSRAEAGDIDPGADARADVGLATVDGVVRERAAAEVVDDGEPAAAGERHELGRVRPPR